MPRRHPYGTSPAAVNLAAILDEMEARGERVPTYFESKIHRWSRDSLLIARSDLPVALKLRLLRVDLDASADYFMQERVPTKLRSHGLSILWARYRDMARLATAGGGGDRSDSARPPRAEDEIDRSPPAATPETSPPRCRRRTSP